MSDSFQQPNGLILVSDVTRSGEDDRPLRVAHRNRDLTRIRRGAYVSAAVGESANRDERYDLRIAAVLGTRRTPVVVSHLSAARVWGIPVVAPWPRQVHVTVSPASGNRSKNGVIVHRGVLSLDEVVQTSGVAVTSLIRTLTDVARTAPFRDAVAALDHALHHGRTSKPELLVALDDQQTAIGRRRALRAIAFASPLAKLPGESFSRVLLHELGFPPPELQHEFETAVGQRFADFWWEGVRLIGEFDGKDKYTNPKYTQDRTPAEVMWAEKQRENELSDHDIRLRRWIWQDLELVQPFIKRLEMAGLRRGRIRELR
ncbi:MAG: hypothetical protein WED09_11510 [Homoserinimonas sp.]